MSSINRESQSVNERSWLVTENLPLSLPLSLARSRENLHQLLHDLSAAGLLINPQGQILAANQQACDLCGVSHQTLLEHSLEQLFTATESQENKGLNFPIQASCYGLLTLKNRQCPSPTVYFSVIANVGGDIHLLMLTESQPNFLNGLPLSATIAPSPQPEYACHALPDTTAQLHLQSVALNACADAIIITDRDGTIEWANPAFTHLTGYQLEEAIGHNPRELVNSGQQDAQFFQQLWQTINVGEVWRGELINRRKDQTHYVEAMTITPVYNQAAEITHFIAIKQDITERKLAEQCQQELTAQVNTHAEALAQINHALQLSEQRYRHVVDSQTELICRFTPDGTLTFVNEAYCRFFNHSSADLVGLNFIDLVPPADQSEVRQQMAELRQLTVAEPILTHEHTVVDANGRVAWHQWINQAFFDAQGQITEIQASGRDITDYKKAEQALRDREHQLDLFFTQSLDGCFVMTLDEPIDWHNSTDPAADLDDAFAQQRVTRANQAILNQYGVSEADFLGVTLNDFFAHDLESGKALVKQFFDQGQLYANTEERRQDGSTIWVDGRYVALHDAHNRIAGLLGVQRDVTALRNLFQTLAESEQQYRLLVENQTELILKLTPDRELLFASPSYCQLFDKSFSELMETNFRPTGHPDDEASSQSQWETLWQPPHTCQIEQRTLTQQGWRWLSWANQAIVDDEGNVTAVIGVGRDVTDRKQAEQALPLSEQRFRHVLETLNMIAIMTDSDSNILFGNDYLLSLTGWQRAEILGQNWFTMFLPKAIQAEVQAIFRKAVDTAVVPAYYENEIVTRTGDRRLIAWNNTVQRNAQGEVISFTSIGEDITDRKRAERQICELSQRLSLATASAELGVWELDYQTGQCTWDERMAAQYGLATGAGQIDFDHWLTTYVHPDDRHIIQASETAILQGAENTQIEFRIVRADGDIRYVEAHTAVVRNPDGNVQRLIGLSRDISDRHHQAAILQETSRRLTLATEAAQLGVWEWNVTNQRLIWDDRMYDLFGVPPSEATGTYQDCEARVHPDDLPHYRACRDRALAEDSAPVFDFRIIRKDGAVRHIESCFNVIRNEAGEAIRVIGTNRDISDRKLNEINLQHTSERLMLATEAAQIGIWEWTVADNRLVWDERMHEIFGVPKACSTGTYQDCEGRVHPDDLPIYYAGRDKALAAGHLARFDFRIIRMDGQVRHIESCFNVVRDEAGQPIRIIGTNRDISDRKASEHNIQQLSNRLRLATEAARLGVWEWDIASDRTVWDDRMYEIHGLMPEAYAGTREAWCQVVHPDDVAIIQREVMVQQEDQPGFHSEFRILRPAGEVRHIEAYGYFVRDAKGQVVRVIGVNEDITDRKRSALELAEAHEILHALMQNSPAIIELYDETGKYHKVNAITARFLGQPAANIEGHHFADLHSPEVTALFMARIQQLVETQQPLVVEDCLKTDGQERVLQSVLFPVLSRPDQPQLLGLVATDITDIVQAQTRLRQQAERERLLRELTANIRHSLDIETVLHTAVTRIREFLQTDRVLIYQFAPDWSGDMTVESVGAEWNSVLGETLRDPCFVDQWIEAYRQGHISQIPDVSTADLLPCHRELLQHYQIQANLILPLVVNDQLWGLLCIHHCCAPRQWQPDEITFIQQIADQVEIAIHQGLLLHQTKIRAQREQVLNEIVKDIRNSLNLEEIMTRTTQKLLTEFHVGRCVVIRCAAEDDYFEYRACAAAPEMADLTGHRLPLQENAYVLSILAQEAPHATADVTHEAQLAPFQPLVQSLKIGSLLSVAIRHEGVVRGILCVHHATPRRWTAPEQILIKQVADQLAIAIQQAELYQQAQAELRQRQRLEEQLRHDALHDSLTGLPNRALFLERLQLALRRYQRYQHPPTEATSSPPATEFAVLFLDLDRFKVINDSLGHAVGDQLLQLVAERLTHCLRDMDIAARLGGDEFVILLEDLDELQFAIEVARRIHNVLEQPVFLDDREIFIRASIGITFSSSYHTAPEQIVQNADIAMYEAKKSGSEYAVFDASMHAIALEQMTLEHDLRHAINRAEFRLYFQPIVALSTGRIVGFEALVRWQHPTRGLLYPGAFVEVAEDTGLIANIDLWVLNQACQQLSQWQQMGAEFRHITVSVNLSGRQFSQPDLIQQIDHALATANLEGRSLKLEITESILITNGSLAVETLNELRARHIQVCMDDFGTGYSSLSYLHQFPVDILKIDKSFILNLNAQKPDLRDYEIVKAIISLALNLNLEVVAEGIEDPDVLMYLQENKCHFGQGYYFTPALAASDATALLRQPPF